MPPATETWLVRKRDGRQVEFHTGRIADAIRKAFRAELNLAEGQPLDPETEADVERIAAGVAEEIAPFAASGPVDVEKVQDWVEIALMRSGHYRVARAYITYRAEHAKKRALQRTEVTQDDAAAAPRLSVTLEDGTRIPFDEARIRRRLAEAARGLERDVNVEELTEEVLRSMFDGISPAELDRAMILAARSRIERDPAHDTVAARLMRMVIHNEALGTHKSDPEDLDALYRHQFEHYLIDGVAAGRLDPVVRTFDTPRLAKALKPERDAGFKYLGLQTIYDRYLLHVEGRRIETPQFFWMRVAMGLASAEGADKSDRAIEFYEVLSDFRFTSATPTLFNSATLHPQLSSCYLTTVQDDLEHIFKSIGDNAALSKWAGGLGNDWTNIRATGSHISGTNGKSQGVIPFLKIVSDAAVAVNQGGKRKGAVCSYLESWHLDIEEFLDLRKNTGDDRRRTHDMHTANWIPDLFMQRMQAGEDWTLFSPNDVPDLHDLYGKAFKERYEHYEALADSGKIKLSRRLPAVDLWRKMLTRVFETGHPWITFKDPSNIRSPQDHCGVVHSSNLCTEILLNTSREETAVCNLGSINLRRHVVEGPDGEMRFDYDLLAETVRTAVRMLDNVVDINFYPTKEAKNANTRHRPVGLGLMGFQDALAALGISFASDEAVEFADESMERISYEAIRASALLASERGPYSSYQGSKWDRGLLPIDTVDLLAEERGEEVNVDRDARLDWAPVRSLIAQHGMRNSNVMAIAPTATISTIVGVAQSIEPMYKHLYVKSNLSGDFTQVNIELVKELKDRGLWGADLLEQLKYYDGALTEIADVPEDVKARYLTAFEVDPAWILACAAKRQKWIDQGQSLNLYMSAPSGKKLSDIYIEAWACGLKTTYYLRTLAATQVEKSTVDVNKFGVQPRWMKNKSESDNVAIERGVVAPAGSPASPSPLGGASPATAIADETPLPASAVQEGAACDPNDPTCEACQ
ncbi:ribonucleoside-diphosphate reductase subunit alpha [Alienimonas californiensis]|uniref:Ribonucleoside-diphosphate reductase n=1 Tax=Alienimonas californiensis TaxID=2527989 RepID=A0A517P4X1_9PLAN|nr:ribonucleoside-diphosphate reductase subunit alpha [Alienimonas californiensis]QDT14432.1 Ribonucleoside-diphosphate reductase 1 subunit alpha [Alienimonas californiensis]